MELRPKHRQVSSEVSSNHRLPLVRALFHGPRRRPHSRDNKQGRGGLLLQGSDNESNQLQDTGELAEGGGDTGMACGATRLRAPDCAARTIHTPKHSGADTYLAGRAV